MERIYKSQSTSQFIQLTVLLFDLGFLLLNGTAEGLLKQKRIIFTLVLVNLSIFCKEPIRILKKNLKSVPFHHLQVNPLS